MRIKEAPSPYLYYSESLSREDLQNVGIKDNRFGEGKTRVGVEDLQARLGLLSMAQNDGAELRAAAPELPPEVASPWVVLMSRSTPGEHFFYNPDTNIAQWEVPPPPGDDEPAQQAQRLIHEVASAAAAAQEQPAAPAAPPVSPPAVEPAAAAEPKPAADDDDDDDDEEVPLPQSKFATALDADALFVKQKCGGQRPMPRPASPPRPDRPGSPS